MMRNRFPGTITDVEGVWVGQAQDRKARTGCTVIVCPEGAVGGVDVGGGSPGTRETDLFHPGNSVEKINAVLLAGGSAFGLDAAGGVMKVLEQKGIGYDVGMTHVPLVCGAVLYDLGVGDPTVRPDERMGKEAAMAISRGAVEEGRVGAGCGATIGKILAKASLQDSGLGTACITLSGGVHVGAIAAVNAFGDVIDAADGSIVAGARNPDGSFIDTAEYMLSDIGKGKAGFNTTLGVVATDAKLSREQCVRLARIAQDGLALAIRPVHTPFDGDTVFALSTGEGEADYAQVCVAAVEVMRRAILNAVR